MIKPKEKSSRYNIGQYIAINYNGSELIGKLIGIDSYNIEAFDGTKTIWSSYTLTSKLDKKNNRFWFACWDKSEWILWIKRENFSIPLKAKLVLGKSGIASLSFAGDSGPSTPTAALAQYKMGKTKYFCLERFIKSKALYFNGYRIQKPKIIHQSAHTPNKRTPARP